MDWDLEDWITDVGANMVDKRIRDSTSLNSIERLVYEIWLLDTEARNGGLSQYFGNHGLEQWRGCVDLAAAEGLETFAPFARSVNALIAGSSDPYKTLAHGDRDHEDLWYSFQPAAVRELRALWEGSR
jgi:hypothetical protein